ncbi:ankyrin repeat protein [Pandoravirus inopinatum]|uniref:Ankyrin repeat protein n=1 Tax=Pandoravirus inopinatum TaxID=1605721 RepID=A0A0B5J983_9VIRU|nr:ankyrin repeat protein [Pandoravirus inopinatum]AJF97396.1 ankyrin repeat protein [Pandoravirus inopinatum]
MSIDGLPDEFLALVLYHVPCIVRARDCAPVCHRWRAIVADDKALEPCIHPRHLCLGKLAEAIGTWGNSLSSLMGADSLPRSSPVLLAAVSKEHLHCMSYARSKGHAWGPDACDDAARCGRLAALKWLIDAGCPHLVALYEGDSCTGHNLVGSPRGVHYYLHRRNIKPLMKEAIKGGHVSCVDWLVSRGMRLDPTTCHMAAKRGHLDMLRYARANGARWDESVVCDSAVRGGQLDVLTYVQADPLLLAKCPWYVAEKDGLPPRFCCGIGCKMSGLGCSMPSTTRTVP